jgi:hypothetical protein
MQNRRFHSQNAGFEISAPIGIGVKISAGGDQPLHTVDLPHVKRDSALSKAKPNLTVTLLLNFTRSNDPGESDNTGTPTRLA